MKEGEKEKSSNSQTIYKYIAHSWNWIERFLTRDLTRPKLLTRWFDDQKRGSNSGLGVMRFPRACGSLDWRTATVSVIDDAVTWSRRRGPFQMRHQLAAGRSTSGVNDTSAARLLHLSKSTSSTHDSRKYVDVVYRFTPCVRRRPTFRVRWERESFDQWSHDLAKIDEEVTSEQEIPFRVTLSPKQSKQSKVKSRRRP